MQNKETLRTLLKTLVETRNNLPVKRKPPLLLKLAPDLQYTERKDIAEILKRKDCRVDGLIISNTTIERPTSLKATDVVKEAGGLSGKPLKNESTQMIADMYKLTDGMTIIGKFPLFNLLSPSTFLSGFSKLYFLNIWYIHFKPVPVSIKWMPSLGLCLGFYLKEVVNNTTLYSKFATQFSCTQS